MPTRRSSKQGAHRTNTHVLPGVGERIRELRYALGISQRDLQAPGVSYAYISRIEAGKRTPSLSTLIHIAERLDTTALYLLTGEVDAECIFCRKLHSPVTEKKGKANGDNKQAGPGSKRRRTTRAE